MTKEQLDALREFLQTSRDRARANGWGLDAAAYYTGRADAFSDADDFVVSILQDNYLERALEARRLVN
jgi:hypothetical protein